MDETVFEAESIDEWLERRAGRAQRLRHVDLAGAARVEIVRRGDARPHLAARIVDRENGDGNIRTERLRAFVREILQALLQGTIDREPMHALIGLERHHLVGRMRRQHRQLLALVRHRLGIWRARSRRAAPRPPPQSDRARGRARPAQSPENGPAAAVPATAASATSKAASAKRQFARLLAEIGQRRRANAFEIAAVGRERQIKSEDFVLAKRVFEFERAHDLPQLGAQGCDARVAPAGAPPAS